MEEITVNFVELVSIPLGDLGTLLASIMAIIGEAGGEEETHIFNLVTIG